MVVLGDIGCNFAAGMTGGKAYVFDPANVTVRKQIWREEHPERFYPTIDAEWQKEQLVKEGYSR